MSANSLAVRLASALLLVAYGIAFWLAVLDWPASTIQP